MLFAKVLWDCSSLWTDFQISKVMHLLTNWKTEISKSVQNFPPGKKCSIWSLLEKSIMRISRKAQNQWKHNNEKLEFFLRSLVSWLARVNLDPESTNQQRLNVITWWSCCLLIKIYIVTATALETKIYTRTTHICIQRFLLFCHSHVA